MTSDYQTLEGVRVDVPGAAFTVRLLAAADPAAPLFLVLPAIAVKARYYLPILHALNEAGFSAAAVDLRAQGESSSEAKNFGYREMLETDLPAIAAGLRERLPQAPLYLFGHSLGGQLALLYAAADDDGTVAGVVTVATGSVYWRAFEPARRASVLLGGQYVGAVSRLRGHWAGGKVMGGPMAGRVMVDWARHSRTGRYRPAGTRRDYDRLLAEAKLRVLMLSLGTDPMGPRSTVDYLAARLRGADVQRVHLEPGGAVEHLDHFGWVKDAPAVAQLVTQWIGDR